jgi:hypothetical protein
MTKEQIIGLQVQHKLALVWELVGKLTIEVKNQNTEWNDVVANVTVGDRTLTTLEYPVQDAYELFEHFLFTLIGEQLELLHRRPPSVRIRSSLQMRKSR